MTRLPINLGLLEDLAKSQIIAGDAWRVVACNLSAAATDVVRRT